MRAERLDPRHDRLRLGRVDDGRLAGLLADEQVGVVVGQGGDALDAEPHAAHRSLSGGGLPATVPAGTLSAHAHPPSLAAFVLAASCGVLAASAAQPAHGFGLDDVARRAKQLAGRAHKDPSDSVPQWLREVDYDQ